MIKAKPLALAQKLKNIVDICEAADTEIENQKLIQKGALDAGKENDGIEPAVVRKILARKKRLSKDPAETTRLEDLMTDYLFMLGEGREDARPWTQADDEVSRVMALTNTGKPPKIEAIKKALGCSQGKAHKLRSIAAVRLAKKSSSSSDENEHEHLPKPEDGDDGITQSCGQPDGGSAEVGADETVAASGPRDADQGGSDDARQLQYIREQVSPAGWQDSDGNTGRTNLVAGDADGVGHAASAGVDAQAAGFSASQPEGTPSAPVAVGAVASESERVAPQTDLEMPSIPSFLDRRTAQGRGA